MTDLYEIKVQEVGCDWTHLNRNLEPNVDIEAEIIKVLNEMHEEREWQLSCEVDDDDGRIMFYNKYTERWREVLNGNFVVTVKKGDSLIHMFTFKLG